MKKCYTRTGHTFGSGGYGFVDEVMIPEKPFPIRGALKTIRDKTGRGNVSMIEGFIMTRLKSPYISSAWDVSVSEDDIKILMAPAIGDMYHIRKNHKIESQVLRRWMWETCRGLYELHRCGILHGDVKASNVLLFAHPDDDSDGDVKTGHCKISDFSLSQVIGDGEIENYRPGLSYTSTHRAPEVWEGLEWGFPADIWACGCTLFEIWKGQSMFRSSEKYEEVKIWFREYHLDPLNVLEELDDIGSLIMEMTTLDPFHRPTIEEVLSHSAFDEVRNDIYQDIGRPQLYFEFNTRLRQGLEESLIKRLSMIDSIEPLSMEACCKISQKIVYKYCPMDNKNDVYSEEKRIVSVFNFHILPI